MTTTIMAAGVLSLIVGIIIALIRVMMEKGNPIGLRIFSGALTFWFLIIFFLNLFGFIVDAVKVGIGS